MNEVHISTFLLERYHIGEVTNEEKLQVENALARDAALKERLAKLESADADFRRKFPQEKFFPTGNKFSNTDVRRDAHRNARDFKTPFVKTPLVKAQFAKTYFVKGRKVSPVVWGVCAAAVLAIVALPFFILKSRSSAEIGERMKGASADGSAIELSVYLKANSTGEGIKLEDQAGIRAGNTVQLAYRVAGDDSAQKYGVIFSIDGRNSVTLHYPYNERQSTRLVSGKPVALDEAYTLDDAPSYEIFFFVTGDKPMEVSDVLNTAQILAPRIARKPQDAAHNALRRGTAAFKDYEIKVFILMKEQERNL